MVSTAVCAVALGGNSLRGSANNGASSGTNRNLRCMADVPSSALPDIPNKKGKTNWVEKAGGLPKLIERVAKHLQAEGRTTSVAIATAVNWAKKMCATGTAFGGKVKVGAKAQAAACKAVASWEAKKGASKARSVAEANIDMDAAWSALLEGEELAPEVESLLIGIVESSTEESLTPTESKVLSELAEAHFWVDKLDNAQKERKGLEETRTDGDSVVRLRTREVYYRKRLEEATGFFDPKKHPRNRKGEFRDVLGMLGGESKSAFRIGTNIEAIEAGKKSLGEGQKVRVADLRTGDVIKGTNAPITNIVRSDNGRLEIGIKGKGVHRMRSELPITIEPRQKPANTFMNAERANIIRAVENGQSGVLVPVENGVSIKITTADGGKREYVVTGSGPDTPYTNAQVAANDAMQRADKDNPERKALKRSALRSNPNRSKR